jgi:hypothetical protein
MRFIRKALYRIHLLVALICALIVFAAISIRASTYLDLPWHKVIPWQWSYGQFHEPPYWRVSCDGLHVRIRCLHMLSWQVKQIQPVVGDYRGFKWEIEWWPGVGPFRSSTGQVIGPKLKNIRNAAFRIPLWAIFIVFAIYPTLTAAIIARAWYRHRHYRKQGHCKECGYNLTGNTSGICPECGERIGGVPRGRRKGNR